MPLPTPIYFNALNRLALEDQNTILQRLYARDETLLQDLLILQQTRADMLDQFSRLGDLEARFNDLNRTIDTILNAFFQDIDGDGDPSNNVAYFVGLIADMQEAIGHADALSAQIIKFDDIQQLITPVGAQLAQLRNLDNLVRTKLDYIYGKWDIDQNDDILSV